MLDESMKLKQVMTQSSKLKISQSEKKLRNYTDIYLPFAKETNPHLPRPTLKSDEKYNTIFNSSM